MPQHPQAELSAWTFADESPAVPASSLTLIEGTSFVICDGAGDIGRGPVDGVFVGDTRICDELVLTVDGERLEPLATTQPSPFQAVMVGRTRSPGLLIFREHWVGSGLRADVRLRNFTFEPRRVTVALAVGSDLAGLFEVKEGRAGRERVVAAQVEDGILWLGAPDDRRSATVRPAPEASIGLDGSVRWIVELPPKGQWRGCVEVAAVRDGHEVPPAYRCGVAAERAVPSARQAAWRATLPTLVTDVPGMSEAVRHAGYDLGALRIFDLDHPDDPVIAAGAPWFMTLFGRDSLITSWMSLVLDPRLALSTVRTLARLQGKTVDLAHDEQPGRILHEVRLGNSTSLALNEGDIYYGTADATPLFVMLVGELRRWGIPLADLKPLLPAVDDALAWIAGPGDLDGDGYVECQRGSEKGLVNQGWKDSWDAVSFADGRLAEGPLALVEVQAYAYGAWLAGAELADAVGDRSLGARRRARAADLRKRFNRDYWLADQQAYALALDCDKRQVDAIASNMGHCLWTGIVNSDRVAAVSDRLLSPELFSGWGVRTLATSMARYDPLSYHNGSVWPHDTAICIAGLRRAGRVDEALRLSTGLLDAASAAGGELPELFSGIGRDEAPVPVAYPGSCRPQAWASASPLLILRSLLGFEPDLPARRVELEPMLPTPAMVLRLDGLPLAASTVTIRVDGDTVSVTGLDPAVLILTRSATAAGHVTSGDDLTSSIDSEELGTKLPPRNPRAGALRRPTN